MNAFYKVVYPLLNIGLLRNIGIVPLLYPSDNVQGFEAYAYNFFADTNYYPPKTGESNFGKGIFAKYSNGTRYHDKTGTTTFSPFQILTPVFEIIDIGSLSTVMYNLHSEINEGKTIDIVINAWLRGEYNQSAVTPLIQLVQVALKQTEDMRSLK
jgi:hypothetical protein